MFWFNERTYISVLTAGIYIDANADCQGGALPDILVFWSDAKVLLGNMYKIGSPLMCLVLWYSLLRKARRQRKMLIIHMTWRTIQLYIYTRNWWIFPDVFRNRLLHSYWPFGFIMINKSIIWVSVLAYIIIVAVSTSFLVYNNIIMSSIRISMRVLAENLQTSRSII